MDWVKPDLWVVALDETETWTIPAKYRGKLLGVQGIYVFDKAQQIHIADTSGSYELWFVMPREVVAKAVSADEGLADEINSFVLGNYDYSEPVTYSYCREIDALLRRYAEGGAKHKYDFRRLGATPIRGWTTTSSRSWTPPPANPRCPRTATTGTTATASSRPS
jgi:hypothetical protein